MSKLKLSRTKQLFAYMDKHPDATPKQLQELFKLRLGTIYSLRTEYKKLRGAIVDSRTKRVASVDLVNHPPHYTTGGIETIDFIRAKLTPEQFKGYLLGNVIKYSSRIGHKGQEKQDAGKLNWYTKTLADTCTKTGSTA